MQTKTVHYQRPKSAIYLSALVIAMTASTSGMAVPLLNNLGGETGYGELALNQNDDSSSNQLGLNFTANFFGNEYSQFFINNNGNISFNNSIRSYTPTAFPNTNQPMIAPFWADVDTRATGNVYVAAPNAQTTVVTWNDVGYYSNNADKTNNFQLVLRDKSNQTEQVGDFDIEFRYDRLEWITGDASNGVNGFGGIPAQAGFDAGDRENFFVLPGSFDETVLNIQNQTNVAGGEEGLWSFAIRNGVTPGTTPENPLLPVILDDAFTFEFGVVDPEKRIFIDPVVAIGYDYEITDSNSPLFASVLLPTGFDDDLYDLQLWNGSDYEFVDQLLGGEAYFFSEAVDRFRILGIEESLEVDPNDPFAFVTGVTFDMAGIASLSQTPIAFDTDSTSVPEPASFGLFGLALALLGFRGKKSS